jgi:hypothetical protein
MMNSIHCRGNVERPRMDSFHYQIVITANYTAKQTTLPHRLRMTYRHEMQ